MGDLVLLIPTLWRGCCVAMVITTRGLQSPSSALQNTFARPSDFIITHWGVDDPRVPEAAAATGSESPGHVPKVTRQPGCCWSGPICPTTTICLPLHGGLVPSMGIPHFIALYRHCISGAWEGCLHFMNGRFAAALCWRNLSVPFSSEHRSFGVSVWHFGNSHNISDFFMIIICVMVICDVTTTTTFFFSNN